jgi:hypothetical protein
MHGGNLKLTSYLFNLIIALFDIILTVYFYIIGFYLSRTKEFQNWKYFHCDLKHFLRDPTLVWHYFKI